MERYSKATSLLREGKPLKWWRDNEVTFPLLSRLAHRYLCIPGTSVAAERVFSTAGYVVAAKRSTLKPEPVDQLMVLHNNLNLPNEKNEEEEDY